MPVTRENAARTGLGIAVLVAFAVLVVRCTWLSDDAYITLRTVDNLLNGHGLRWNVAERVQTYTHPLWMLLLVPAHAGFGPYWGAVGLGWITSLLAVGGLWFGASRTPHAALLACVPLLMSKAFVDFSTSGLENPLSHLLLVGLVGALGRPDGPRDVGLTASLGACAALVRPDLVLLAAPAVVLHLRRAGPSRAVLAAVAVGALPLVVWEGFSLVYYGSLVPNTALAKLGTGIPRSELVAQGLQYLVWSARVDPVTPIALLGGGLLVAARGEDTGRALTVGAALWTAYVVWVGGDFMGGRFLTPPLFAVMLGVSRADVGVRAAAVAAALAAGIGVLTPWSPVRAGVHYERAPAWEGIVDERGYYHRGAGLIPTGGRVRHPFAKEGSAARELGPHGVVRATVGYFGYHAGPEVHVTDRLGLGDPFLARLPARYDPTWRIGHFRREIPAGYDPFAGTCPDRPDLASLCAQVTSVVRGPLLDPGRLRTALALMVGGSQVDTFAMRFPELEAVDHLPVGGQRVGTKGLSLAVDPPRGVRPTVGVRAGEAWRVLYVRERAVLADHEARGDGPVALPPSEGPVDAVLFVPVTRAGGFDLGAVDLGGPAR